MRLLFLVPTTGGPLVINALRERAGLPASAAFAAGDYRPLPWSADYARLSASGGPLSTAIPGLSPHELRLSGSFDAGRSWEAPVALAHLLLARGHTLADDPARSDAIIFATGAVDLDLELIPGDYALADKIYRLADMTARAPQIPIVAVLPGSGDEEELFNVVCRPGLVQRVRATRMVDVADEVEALLGVTAPKKNEEKARRLQSLPQTVRRTGWLAPAAIGLVALIGAAGVVAWRENMSMQKGLEPPAPVVGSTETPPRDAGGGAKAQPSKESRDANQQKEPPPSIEVSEVRAPAGASCIGQLFGSGKTERKAVRFEAPDRLADSHLTQDLCAIAIKPLKARTRVVVLGDLALAALPPTAEADGAILYHLKARLPQKIVYRIHISTKDDGDASGLPIRHEIKP